MIAETMTVTPPLGVAEEDWPAVARLRIEAALTKDGVDAATASWAAFYERTLRCDLDPHDFVVPLPDLPGQPRRVAVRIT